MAGRKLTIQCDTAVRDILCTAIRDYAHAAYPPGSSECAQVARYTLLELADAIGKGIVADGDSVQISRRPRAMIRAALQYHFDRLDARCQTGSSRQRALLAGLLEERRTTAAQLAAARADDAADRTVSRRSRTAAPR